MRSVYPTRRRGSFFTATQCHVSHDNNAQAMEQGLREVCRSVRIGKILIQRVSSIFSTFYRHVALTYS